MLRLQECTVLGAATRQPLGRQPNTGVAERHTCLLSVSFAPLRGYSVRLRLSRGARRVARLPHSGGTFPQLRYSKVVLRTRHTLSFRFAKSREPSVATSCPLRSHDRFAARTGVAALRLATRGFAPHNLTPPWGRLPPCRSVTIAAPPALRWRSGWFG